MAKTAGRAFRLATTVALALHVFCFAATVLADGHALDLLVVKQGWGKARRETVEKVLYSAAEPLWKHFPERSLKPIIVQPTGGPITLFQRGPDGEIFIRLNTGDTYWSQYAYQFSHEFCHVLCNSDRDPHGNDWFEESLCEMASLFALRRMSETWKTSPPFEHWKEYAPHLASYAQDRMNKSRLDKDQSFARWFAQHEEKLHESAYLRDLNAVVAQALLPLFEKSPQHWRAVVFLNDARPTAPQPFNAYLRDWYLHAPPEERPFILSIADEFGISIN